MLAATTRRRQKINRFDPAEAMKNDLKKSRKLVEKGASGGTGVDRRSERASRRASLGAKSSAHARTPTNTKKTKQEARSRKSPTSFAWSGRRKTALSAQAAPTAEKRRAALAGRAPYPLLRQQRGGGGARSDKVQTDPHHAGARAHKPLVRTRERRAAKGAVGAAGPRKRVASPSSESDSDARPSAPKRRARADAPSPQSSMSPVSSAASIASSPPRTRSGFRRNRAGRKLFAPSTRAPALVVSRKRPQRSSRQKPLDDHSDAAQSAGTEGDAATEEAAAPVSAALPPTTAAAPASPRVAQAAPVQELLKEAWPGRERQIEAIRSLMGVPSTVPPPMLLFGYTATGKASVMRAVLDAANARYAFVDALAFSRPWQLFRAILAQLSPGRFSTDSSGSHPGEGAAHPGEGAAHPGEGTADPAASSGAAKAGAAAWANRVKPVLYGDASEAPRCEDLSDFARELQLCARDRRSTTYIVIQHAARLQLIGSDLVNGLLRMPLLTGTNSSVVFIAESPVAVLRGIGSLSSFADCVAPELVQFPQYSDVEVLEILGRDCPRGEDPAFFRTFLTQVWGVFGRVCGADLRELRYIVRSLFPAFAAPVHDGTVPREDTGRLFSMMQPAFRALRERLYHHDVDETAIARSSAPPRDVGEGGGGAGAGVLGGVEATAVNAPTQQESAIELPYYAKYLLISAFLASFNPPDSDTRFFARESVGRRSRRRPRRKGKAKLSQQLIGPRVFPLERLLAIFHALVAGQDGQSASRAASTSELLASVASLVALGLLARVSQPSELDAPRLRCDVERATVIDIARRLDFNLGKYLYDQSGAVL